MGPSTMNYAHSPIAITIATPAKTVVAVGVELVSVASRTASARPMRTISSTALQGRFPLLRHDPVGGSSGRSVCIRRGTGKLGAREPPSSRRGRCIYRAEARRGAEGRSAGW